MGSCDINNELTSYSNLHSAKTQDIEVHESSGYLLPERHLQPADSPLCEMSSDVCSQPSQSDNLSQISTWSDEINPSLNEINSALKTISGGKVSPLKFQLRTDYEMLTDTTQRAIKRKAISAVHGVLHSIAPGQESKLLKLIQMETNVEEDRTSSSDIVNVIVKLFQESTSSHTKRQLLSLIVNQYTKKNSKN